MSKLRLAVFFGGISVEHEVSVLTGIQLLTHADQTKYEVTPIYIDKTGNWWTGSQLFDVRFFKQINLFHPTGLEPIEIIPAPGKNPIDCALLCFHGKYGEAGNVQGLLELAATPYQGPAVTSSAICFDKIFLRLILQAAGVAQPAFVWFTLSDWQTDQSAILEKINSTLSGNLFIKPANGGSTVGITRITDRSQLSSAIAEVAHYDNRILVESEILNCIEVNVSVLGTVTSAQASVAEHPIKQDDFLSYADKYQRGGAKKVGPANRTTEMSSSSSGMASASRQIPAPLSPLLTQKVKDTALKVFRLLDCSGVIRIDFFVNQVTDEIFVIEPNTIPGSMSFYLWQATGLPYQQLIDTLVEIAYHQHQNKQQLISSFDSTILK